MNEVIGNKKNIEHFSLAAAAGKLSHAYIINGPEGSGKETFAEFVAEGLLCNEISPPDDGGQQSFFAMAGGKPAPARALKDGPCGVCPACVRSMSGNHPDIIRVTHEKENVISVNEIRAQLVNDVMVKPYYGPYKIYIIPDAELINEHGQNALLKTIEEPPEYVITLLLTDNADLFLDTIRSRCIRFDMERLPTRVIEENIRKKYSLPENDIKAVAAFAAGNLGVALKMARAGGLGAAGEAAQLLKKAGQLSALEISAFAATFKKTNAPAFVETVRMWYRDALSLKCADGALELYFPLERDALKKQSEKISFEGFNNIFNAINKAKERISFNVKPEAVVECLLLAVRREQKW